MNPNSLGERVAAYLIQSLAASGIAVLDAGVMFSQRRDLWAQRQTASFDMTVAMVRIEEMLAELSVRRFMVRFADRPEERIRVVARSSDNLAQRLLWLVGREVLAVEEVAELYAKPAQAENLRVPPASDGGPPAYHCRAREEWFERRGLKDPTAQRPAEGPGPSTGY